jgi:cell division protein FtsZ
LGLFEINEAAKLVADAAHPEANIIFGAVIDDTLGDEVRVTVIAAGFDGGLPAARRSRIDAAAANSSPAPAAFEPSTPVEEVAVEEAVVVEKVPAGEPFDATTAPTSRRVVFDDNPDSDELDIPDFLK